MELSHEVVEVLSARIVCSAANNQLAHDGIEKRLAERDTTYAPDYCVNSGRVPLSQPLAVSARSKTDAASIVRKGVSAR